MGEDLLCGLYLVCVIGWQIVPPSILGQAKGLPNAPLPSRTRSCTAIT
jgi:hypothetical protein